MHNHDHHHTAAGHSHTHEHDHSLVHENKTRIVVILTAVTMVVEITFGYWTNSMALLADGYHMSSHVLALGLSWLAYFLARKYSNTEKFSFRKEKLLALSGFTSAIILQVIAVVMAVESFQRLIDPLPIKFTEAIFVAAIGLVVNALSAVFLHHDHAHTDHNIRSAYLHVLADGLTSVTAIIALTAGMYYNMYSLDAISGLISSIVITRWAIQLIKGSGKTLIEFSHKHN
jgi:cation diffusion facilitator family transporter